MDHYHNEAKRVMLRQARVLQAIGAQHQKKVDELLFAPIVPNLCSTISTALQPLCDRYKSGSVAFTLSEIHNVHDNVANVQEISKRRRH